MGWRLSPAFSPPRMASLISIIVPVYNCEAYLEQCLRSIADQGYPDFEVLLINDGSTDCSGSLCDAFAAGDSRFQVTHKTNGGVSSARNLALDQIRGDYVVFIDADDYVDATFLSKMVEALNDGDVVACAYDRVRPSGSQPFVLGQAGPISLEALYEHTLCTQWIGGGCCNKIFRADLIRQMNLRFDTRIAVGEDMLFLVQYYQRCRSAAYVGDVLYHYRFNEVSATEAGFAQKKVNERTASILLALDAMAQRIDAGVGYQRQALAFRRVRSGMRLFFQMVLSRTRDPALMTAIEGHVRAGLQSFLASRHARLFEKLVAVAMAFSTRLTYWLAVALSGVLAGRLASYRT